MRARPEGPPPRKWGAAEARHGCRRRRRRRRCARQSSRPPGPPIWSSTSARSSRGRAASGSRRPRKSGLLRRPLLRSRSRCPPPPLRPRLRPRRAQGPPRTPKRKVRLQCPLLPAAADCRRARAARREALTSGVCVCAVRQGKEERAAPAHVAETKKVAGAVKAAKSAARQFQQTGSKPREAAKAALTATGASKKKSQKKRSRESGAGEKEAPADKAPRVTRVYAGTCAPLAPHAVHPARVLLACGSVVSRWCEGRGWFDTCMTGGSLQVAARVARSRRPRRAYRRGKKRNWLARARGSHNSRARQSTNGSECAWRGMLQIIVMRAGCHAELLTEAVTPV